MTTNPTSAHLAARPIACLAYGPAYSLVSRPAVQRAAALAGACLSVCLTAPAVAAPEPPNATQNAAGEAAANLLRGNTVRTTTAWPFVVGNPKPEDAIQVNPSLPTSLQNFKPGKVTAINGKAVSGTAGDGSACPNCVIELFLDDTDAITEALSSLAVVTATAAGTWSATLPNALASGQGIRTTSTSAQFNTIAGLNAGTTTGLSRLYRIHRVFVPRVGR